MVPSKWRPKSGKTELSVLPWPLGDQQFLLVLPPTRWNLLLERLNEMSLSDDEAAVVERVIGGSSARLILDKAGRLCLPEELAAVASAVSSAADEEDWFWDFVQRQRGDEPGSEGFPQDGAPAWEPNW